MLMGMSDQAIYQSRSPFDPARVGAAAIYCSDGRYGEQMDEYLHQGCGWPRYDRIAVPGGPAMLSSELSVLWEESFMRKTLEFLVRTHQLKHVALIAHENCGFYREWLRIAPDKIEQRQRNDLAQARRRIHAYLPNLEVHTLMARTLNGSVCFFESD